MFSELFRLSSSAGSGWPDRRWVHLFRQSLFFATLLGIGLWVRSLVPLEVTTGLAAWRPWDTRTTVTLYFAEGQFLFPVSRRMPIDGDLPRAALRALIAGPSAESGLTGPVPPGVEIRSLEIADDVARVDLSSAFLVEHSRLQAAQTAIVATMTALPGVNSVSLTVEGQPLIQSRRMPLLYFASADGLIAVPAGVEDPRAAVARYLAGPPDPELTGLPADVQLLTYEYKAANGSVSLNFTYTPSVQALALHKPERMRTVLLGLITSLTEFRDVRTVWLDFEGHARLGLGQCSDLLRTPQPRPTLLNDERLLARFEWAR